VRGATRSMGAATSSRPGAVDVWFARPLTPTLSPRRPCLGILAIAEGGEGQDQVSGLSNVTFEGGGGGGAIHLSPSNFRRERSGGADHVGVGGEPPHRLLGRSGFLAIQSGDGNDSGRRCGISRSVTHTESDVGATRSRSAYDRFRYATNGSTNASDQIDRGFI